MKKWLDLTGRLENGMWNYGAPFPEIAVEKVANVAEDGYEGHAFRLHSLAGTYLETANHLFADRELLGDVGLDRLTMRAWVAQLPDKRPYDTIAAAELERAVGSALEPGDALLIATGWDSRWNRPGYTESSPYFEPEAMDWIIGRDVGLLGMDITTIEDPRKPGGEMPMLKRYYAKDRLMAAPLVRLREAGEGPWTLTVLPLNIPDVCAAPCRAILFRP
ncbi:cyclase family protein [Cohnella hashimotonis]|uniref:Cyclase family protein n=1 Tax=Cohnella hashimotonis TaxID=2826895 RepID=A0ABT6TDV3_9BACL|nr:cyclase family protein [Cohnella hashimotonis]MDI4645004.1 cyclase family protein [Cohnella hashimotonis]